ncbi:restriction endonuclease [Variovorax sp. LARHSF232]
MSDPDRVRRGRKSTSSAASRAKGWLVALLGLLVLLASHQLPQDSLFATVAQALRPVAWLALVLGLIYLGFQRIARPLPGHTDAPAEDDPHEGMTRPSVLQALGVGRGGAVPELEPNFVDTIAVHPVAGDDGADEVAAPRETSWSPRVLSRIDQRQFEALCRAFFKQAGFATSVHGQAGDGDVIDIWVQSRHMSEPRVVRCRHLTKGRSVSAPQLRDFLRVMSTQGLAHGTYVTSTTFDSEAMEFAKANGIQMQDGAALLKLIAHRSPEEQQALLDIACGEQAGPG